jgi:histone H3/H4
MIINKSRVKEAAGDFRVSSDFYEALDAFLVEEIDKAKERADENGRSTLMPYDV